MTSTCLELSFTAAGREEYRAADRAPIGQQVFPERARRGMTTFFSLERGGIKPGMLHERPYGKTSHFADNKLHDFRTVTDDAPPPAFITPQRGGASSPP